MNLTGLKTPEKIVVELFLDSLIPAPFLPSSGKMIDLGTGSGMPGIPLKIYSQGLEVYLLEASSKKASFLKHVTRLISLKDLHVINKRIEAFSMAPEKEKFQIITIRALAKLKQTIMWSVPLLTRGGYLVRYSGQDSEDELKENEKSIINAHLRLVKKIPYKLPGKSFSRNILIFQKKN